MATSTAAYETLTQAALRTGLSTRTLRRRIAEGTLVAYRMGPRIVRVKPSEVDALLVPTSAYTARSG